MDIKKGDVIAWPTNLGWMMGPWLVYASLLNGASIALYNGSPLGSGFAKFVQVNFFHCYTFLVSYFMLNNLVKNHFVSQLYTFEIIVSANIMLLCYLFI